MEYNYYFACVLSLIFMVITNVIGKKLGFGNGIKILIYVFILGTEILGEIYHFMLMYGGLILLCILILLLLFLMLDYI